MLILLILSACSSHEPVPYDGLIIGERNPDKFTYISRQNLHQLEQIYNLKAFSFQRNIVIDSQAKDHKYLDGDSAIILNSTHFNNPQKLLAAWLHEEFHWWARSQEKELIPVLNTLKKYYPKSSQATRLHLVVSYLEYEALRFYLEDKEARLIIHNKIKKDKKFPWLYQQVLTRTKLFKKTLSDHNLLPEVLN